MSNLLVILTQVISWSYLFWALFILIIIWRASRNPNSKFTWVDLISNPDGTASLTRTLQLIAGLTGTWVIVKMTVTSILTLDFFTVYLAAMGISEAFNKWINSRGQQ